MNAHTDIQAEGNGIAAAELRSFIERIENVEAEIKALNDDKKDIYAELKARGYDAKAVKQIVAMRRQDPSERQEHESIVELYMSSLGML